MGKMSTHLWGVDWDSFFPYAIPGPNELIVSVVDFSELADFFGEHYSQIHELQPESHRFVPDRMSAAKVRYYEMNADCFAFKSGSAIIGGFIGNPVDWSTYYVRTCTLLKSYQGHGLGQAMLKRIVSILGESGVERVESDASPGNWVSSHIFTSLGFRVTGTILSERWGALSRYTKFLVEKNETVFLDQFTTGVRVRLNP